MYYMGNLTNLVNMTSEMISIMLFGIVHNLIDIMCICMCRNNSESWRADAVPSRTQTIDNQARNQQRQHCKVCCMLAVCWIQLTSQ